MVHKMILLCSANTNKLSLNTWWSHNYQILIQATAICFERGKNSCLWATPNKCFDLCACVYKFDALEREEHTSETLNAPFRYGYDIRKLVCFSFSFAIIGVFKTSGHFSMNIKFNLVIIWNYVNTYPMGKQYM